MHREEPRSTLGAGWTRYGFFFFGVGVGSGGGRKAVGWMFWVGTVGQELAETENTMKRGAAGEQWKSV